MDIADLEKMKNDIEIDFIKNIHNDDLKSGLQTKSNLHIIHNEIHWNAYYNKLNNIMLKMSNKKITKSWSLKIVKNEKNFFHKHKEDSFTSVFFLQNDDYFLGTHLKSEQEFIVPGYENSLLIFHGNILHDAVFPSYELKKPRYTIVTDYE